MPSFIKNIECNGWTGVFAWTFVVIWFLFLFDFPFPKFGKAVKIVAVLVFGYYVFWEWGR